MSPLIVLALGLESLAAWIDEQDAVHAPPRWIAQQASEGIREAIRMAREADHANLTASRREHVEP